MFQSLPRRFVSLHEKTLFRYCRFRQQFRISTPPPIFWSASGGPHVAPECTAKLPRWVIILIYNFYRRKVNKFKKNKKWDNRGREGKWVVWATPLITQESLTLFRCLNELLVSEASTFTCKLYISFYLSC
jgi:hypothetical protein